MRPGAEAGAGVRPAEAGPDAAGRGRTGVKVGTRTSCGHLAGCSPRNRSKIDIYFPLGAALGGHRSFFATYSDAPGLSSAGFRRLRAGFRLIPAKPGVSRTIRLGNGLTDHEAAVGSAAAATGGLHQNRPRA